jgi:hypothetical protein
MGCEVYQTGRDEIYFHGEDWVGRFKWIVYDYEDHSDDYYGTGEAMALTNDGKLMSYDLGHCSCYGPLNDMSSGDGSIVDRKTFLASQDDVHQGERHAYIEKIIELLLLEGE